MQSTDEIEQMMSEASIDAVTATLSVAQQQLGHLESVAAGLQNRMIDLQNRIIEQIVQDEDDEIPLPPEFSSAVEHHFMRSSALTFSLDETGLFANVLDDMLAEVDRRFTSTSSFENTLWGNRAFSVKGRLYRIHVDRAELEATVSFLTKHRSQTFTGTSSFIHFLDLLDARQTQADRARAPYIPPIVVERVVHPAQARVTSMQAYVEDTFPHASDWEGQMHWQEDWYSDGVMTSFRMVTLPIIGDTLFKFVEDGDNSCCVVSLDEPVIIYTMEQLTDVLAAVTTHVARRRIQDTMLISYQPQPADQCPVCLVEGAEEEGGDSSWVSLSLCSHRFHRTCIGAWPCTTCPLCRANHAV